MAERFTLLRKGLIVTLDILAVIAGTLIASPFVLVIIAPFVPGL